ncbi:hypothetical protein FRX31_028333 [Thalictrum thalictroides]|uniref:Uncharacterized protein n=1 Tax=Thalictrum thalictroides TaxID=46969 RepID=A0A7J6VCX9_THATH|nr:hypothetical protein FRX31_028333 [Thalictrum thalictroides]
MDRTDFDLTRVEIDLTQFDGVFLEDDQHAELTIISPDKVDQHADDQHADMEHDELARSITDDDLSRKRKVPETDPQFQSLHSDISVVKENVSISSSEKVVSVNKHLKRITPLLLLLQIKVIL